MKTLLAKIFIMIILLFSILTCAQSSDNPMQSKVMEFNASKTGTIKWVRVYPLKIGPDRLTVRHNIIIEDNQLTRKIIDMLIFPDNPSLPKSLDHSGSQGGVGLHIAYDNGKEFYIFAMFRQGFRGQAIEYKLSRGPLVEARDDPNLPGNYLIGHGFSSELYELLHDAIESSTTERPIWMSSRW